MHSCTCTRGLITKSCVTHAHIYIQRRKHAVVAGLHMAELLPEAPFPVDNHNVPCIINMIAGDLFFTLGAVTDAFNCTAVPLYALIGLNLFGWGRSRWNNVALISWVLSSHLYRQSTHLCCSAACQRLVHDGRIREFEGKRNGQDYLVWQLTDPVMFSWNELLLNMT